MAVYEAAQDAVRQLKERAAKLWEKKPEEVEFDDGVLQRQGQRRQADDDQGARAAARAHRRPDHRTRDASMRAAVGPAFAATCVDVEVDPDTGKVADPARTVAQDAGKAIHPSYVEGQMQGGTAQGIGWALNEEYFYDDKGILRNTGLLDYRMPTCLDLPMIETVIVEVPNPGHPLGVARRRRGLDRAAAGRGRQRDLPRDRRADDGAADVAAALLKAILHKEGASVASAAAD